MTVTPEFVSSPLLRSRSTSFIINSSVVVILGVCVSGVVEDDGPPLSIGIAGE